MSQEKPLVVACIPAFDEEGVVLRASRHVDRVIVCDGGSTDMAADYERKAFLLSHAERVDIPID